MDDDGRRRACSYDTGQEEQIKAGGAFKGEQEE